MADSENHAGAPAQQRCSLRPTNQPQVMVTLQSLLQLMAFVAGPLVGGMVAGKSGGGWLSVLIGAVVGLLIALAIVEAPYRLLAYLDRRRLQRTTTDGLYQALADGHRHFGRLDILREF